MEEEVAYMLQRGLIHPINYLFDALLLFVRTLNRTFRMRIDKATIMSQYPMAWVNGTRD